MRLILTFLLFLVASSPSWAANTAALAWTAPTQYEDGTPLAAGTVLTYGVYQGVQGQPKSRVATATATSATISTGLANGTTYCWAVTAIANGVESAPSAEACKSFPWPATQAPTGLTVR